MSGWTRSTRVSGRLRRFADAVANFCGLAFAAFFTYQSLASVVEMYRFSQGAEMIDLPYWPPFVILGLTAIVLFAAFPQIALWLPSLM